MLKSSRNEKKRNVRIGMIPGMKISWTILIRGYRAKYHDSKLVGEPKICAGNQGTSLTIEDLFYNVPMRRKSLKSNGEEYSKILDIISKYALANPHIGFICKKVVKVSQVSVLHILIFNAVPT